MPASIYPKKCLRPALAGLLFCLFLTSPALAADYVWDGGAGTQEWDDGANWDPNAGHGGPASGDDAIIDTGPHLIYPGAHCDVISLSINTAQVSFTSADVQTGALNVNSPGGSTIIMLNHKLEVTGSLNHGSTKVTLQGVFHIHGNNTITGTGPVNLNFATLHLYGDQTLPMSGTGGINSIILLYTAGTELTLNGGTVEYRGRIFGAGSLRIAGDVSLSPQVANSYAYSGNTTVDSGSLTVNGNNILPSTTTLSVVGGASCSLGTQTLAAITGSGSVTSTGDLTLSGGTGTFGGTINSNNLEVTGGADITLDGTTTTVGDIVFNGATLTLNGTANRGIAQNGGTLLGTGSCAGLLDLAGGAFAPGGSIGTFNAAGGLSMAGGATLDMEVSGAAADQVNVTGSVTLNNPLLNLSGTPTVGANLTIINNDAGDAVISTFAGLAEGATFTSGGHDYEITYAGGDGNNDVVLTALTGNDPTPPGPGPGPAPDPDPEPSPSPSGPAAPSVPQGVGPNPAGSLNGPAFSWPQVKGAKYYWVYRADCPNCKRKLVGRVKENSFIDPSALSGKPYYYWLRSENGEGVGPYSDWLPAWRYEQNPGRAGDFNGDGIMDLLWWDTDTNKLTIWFMKHGAVQKVSVPGDGLNVNEWLLLTAADFNGDGTCDLLWWKPETGETLVWYLDKTMAVSDGGGGNWFVKTNAALDTMPSQAALAHTGDLNGDGRADILWCDSGSGQVTVWLMGGDGKPSLNGPPTPADESITRGDRPGVTGRLEWQVVGLSDINADGKADVIWKDARNNRLATWTMDASNISAVIQENKGLDTVWRAVGPGDLNGDNQADIVWRNEASGEVQAWLMQAGVFSEERSMLEGSSEAINWQVKAVGDFCAPGCDDVYCKNSETGAARIITLDGQEYAPTVE